MNLRNSTKTTLATLMLGLAISVPASADEAPPANSVSIQSINTAGPGCYLGSVASNISQDGKAMTLLFDDFIVATDDTPGPKTAKSCNVNMGIKVPSGWSYALFCVDFRGYAALDKGVTGKQVATYTFDGSRKTQVGQVNLTGPLYEDYSNLTALPLNSLSWSPCGTGEVKPLQIDANVEVALPPPVALDHRRGEDLADDLEDSLGRIRWSVRRYERGLYNTVKHLKKVADDLEEDFDDRRDVNQLRNRFNQIKGPLAEVLTKIDANARLRNDRRVSRELPKIKKAKAQIQAMLFPAPAGALGLMTVDSLDGNLQHHYGIAWKRCNPHQRGEWVQSDGRKKCTDVCRAKGKTLSRSPDGAQCVSGEVRPLSAQGKIEFVRGCWPNCAPHNNIRTDAHRNFCYHPGQKKDWDRTDRAVGCFCE